MEISFYPHIKETRNGDNISVDMFLNNIKVGTYANLIEEIQKQATKEQRTLLKERTLPYAACSGTFNVRSEAGLVHHSGLICLDIDGIENVDQAFDRIIKDPFTFSAFRSASGTGIAVLVKIDGRRHRDAFFGLERYYAQQFRLTLDIKCKDVSRPRYVSYDKDLYKNPDSQLFKTYIPKEISQIEKKAPQIITGKHDMDYIIRQIHDKGIDLTMGDYYRYLYIGFALVNKYGDSGETFFHEICRMGPDYDRKHAEEQYKKCLKARNRGITIGTLYGYCKEFNIDLVTPETKLIVTVAYQAKKGDRKPESAIELLKQLDNIPEEISKSIVDEVFSSNFELKTSTLSEVGQMKVFLRNNYNIKKNEITRLLENNGHEIDKKQVNSIYIRILENINDKIPRSLVENIIESDFIEDYNPIKEWFEAREHIIAEGEIDKLCSSINSGPDSPENYKDIFIKKWLVGIIASVYGHFSSLALVLAGPQGAGKTPWLRQLPPPELRGYLAESKLDEGKDDYILMTQKLIILNDEFGGKTRQEAKLFKEITSKDKFTLREPYGRHNVTLTRLASICGTTNEVEILNDPTGNKRVIPVPVQSIIWDVYNDCDKEKVFMEAYHLYKAGFKWELNSADIAYLNKHTEGYEQIRSEMELIKVYFKPTDKVRREEGESIEFMQSTEIKAYIEKCSGQKISGWKLGHELTNLGYKKESRKFEGVPRHVYAVVKIKFAPIDREEGEEEPKKEDVPF